VARIRTFAAVPLSPALSQAIGEVIADLQCRLDDVKWVLPGNAHLTLQFFGGIEEEAVPALASALAGVAAQVAPFPIEVRATGAFPSLRRARVLWLGVDEPDGALSELAEAVMRATKALGYEVEDRPYEPHLTIGRCRSKHGAVKGAEQALGALAERSFGQQIVNEIVLFRTILGPEGPTYVPLERVPLVGPPSV
jgi:2'-5' RNA ligase